MDIYLISSKTILLKQNKSKLNFHHNKLILRMVSLSSFLGIWKQIFHVSLNYFNLGDTRGESKINISKNTFIKLWRCEWHPFHSFIHAVIIQTYNMISGLYSSHTTGGFEIRSDPCSTHIWGISWHGPGYFREASISSIMKVSWTQHCVFSYDLKEWTSWK